MATILEFRSSDVRSQAARHAAPEASAEIVIFPGVRYERWVEEPKPARATNRRARRRDVLELEE